MRRDGRPPRQSAILLSAAQPVHVLTASATVGRIVNMAALLELARA
jgi:phosphotransacetylase